MFRCSQEEHGLESLGKIKVNVAKVAVVCSVFVTSPHPIPSLPAFQGTGGAVRSEKRTGELEKMIVQTPVSSINLRIPPRNFS